MNERALPPTRLVTAEQLIAGHKADGRAVYRPEAKRILVDAAVKPGASIAAIARQHDLNANQLHAWIRQAAKLRTPKAPHSHRAHAPRQDKATPRTATLVPVMMRQDAAPTPPNMAHDLDTTHSRGNGIKNGSSIVIRLHAAEIELNGAVNRDTLSAVLDCLKHHHRGTSAA